MKRPCRILAHHGRIARRGAGHAGQHLQFPALPVERRNAARRGTCSRPPCSKRSAALVHFPHHQHAHRKGHPRQRSGALRRGIPALASKAENRIMYGWASISAPAAAARCWWTPQGECAAGFTAPHEEMRMERPMWAEQRPENWWEAAQKAIRGVLRGGRRRRRRRSRASAFPARCTAWYPRRGRPRDPAFPDLVRPAQPAAGGLRSTPTWARENVLALTANPVLTGFTLPKLLWVRDNEPANFDARAQDAAAEGLRALPAHRRVRHRSLRRLRHGVLRRGEPALVLRDDGRPGARPRHPAARVTSRAMSRARSRAAAAEATGLKAGTPVVGGGGDQAAERAWATASSSRASSRARSAPPAWCSPTWTRWPTIPPGASTPSATPCAASGT